MKSVGAKVHKIDDKQYRTLETENAEKIIKGLELSKIPFFAKYDENKIVLAYCKKDKDKVGQILAKGVCGYDEDLLLFMSEPDSRIYAKLLLPEISEILGVSVSQLESKPIDIQIMLAQTYVNYWHSDDESIKKALKLDIYVHQDKERMR